jgi:hypothetical protein
LICQFHHFQIFSLSTCQSTSYNGQEGNEKTGSLFFNPCCHLLHES